MTNINSTNEYYQNYTTKTSVGGGYTGAQTISSVFSTPPKPADVVPEVSKMTEEEIKDMATWLENTLQDTLDVCSNECCEDKFDHNFIPDLAVKLVQVIAEDYNRPLTEIEKLLKSQIVFLNQTVDKLLKQLKEKNVGQFTPNENYGIYTKYKNKESKAHWDNDEGTK
jgi:hypothetical protein